jgi:hypothetical protein
MIKAVYFHFGYVYACVSNAFSEFQDISTNKLKNKQKHQISNEF